VDERILIIEDDEALGRLMRLQLERVGYEVSTCLGGEEALDRTPEFGPDLILLDILLPGLDGWSVCEELRQISEAPIIFTTALGSSDDMIRGLELGADDYIIKPFSYNELLARVRAALHRAQRAAARRLTYRYGHLSVNLETRMVRLGDERIILTPLEYKLLATLVQDSGRVVSHETLLRRVWGPQYEDRRQYLKLYIWYLRQKIEEDPSNPQTILTERGVGYRIIAPTDTD